MADQKIKPIILIGPPRSGTSVTAKILQAHFGVDFPFRVNRHAEPEEMVLLTNDLLTDVGMQVEDRLYPFYLHKGKNYLEADFKYQMKLKEFLDKYKGQLAVIKEPISWLFYVRKVFSKDFNFVTVNCPAEHRAMSFIRHKEMNLNVAFTASYFWDKLFTDEFGAGDITFNPKNTPLSKAGIKKVLRDLYNIEFKEEIFNRFWDDQEVQSYRK